MTTFICPVCGQPLESRDKTRFCQNGHSYDISKYGYVNLLMSSASGKKRHGDDRLMAASRRAFLDKGYYNCLLDALAAAALEAAPPECTILDVGCGDCWYSINLLQRLEASGVSAGLMGVDISKDALIVASKRKKDIQLAVASTARLPVAEASVDIGLCFFAPCHPAELSRVIKPGGTLIRAIPLERHLYGLKERLYDKPYLNRPSAPELEGFRLVKELRVEDALHLTDQEDIENLFRMTPYYYKTSAADQQKCRELTEVETEIQFGLRVYKRP